MPCPKFIIENVSRKELRLLRGKSNECANLIGLAVGSEKHKLVKSFLRAKREDENHDDATEEALIDEIDVDAVLPCWLSWLPIWEDEEVVYVYSFLCKFLENNHPLILGVPLIVSLILEVFARSVIEHTSELGHKLIQFVKIANVSTSISFKFSMEQQQALEQINKL